MTRSRLRMEGRKRVLIGAIGIFLAFSTYRLSAKIQMDLAADTEASSISVAWAVTCEDQEIVVFVPNIDYSLTWGAVSSSGSPAPSASLGLTNPIHGQSAPAVTATLDGSSGHVILANPMPEMKIAGGMCQASFGESQLQIYGDGSDNSAFDIAIQNLADDDTTFNADDKIDHTTSGAMATLFGANGLIATSNLSDGSDFDAVLNGEIEFGGTNESAGGSAMHLKVDVTNYDVDPSTDVETLTYNFGPQ
jgi:hypothetical protein